MLWLPGNSDACSADEVMTVPDLPCVSQAQAPPSKPSHPASHGYGPPLGGFTAKETVRGNQPSRLTWPSCTYLPSHAGGSWLCPGPAFPNTQPQLPGIPSPPPSPWVCCHPISSPDSQGPLCPPLLNDTLHFRVGQGQCRCTVDLTHFKVLVEQPLTRQQLVVGLPRCWVGPRASLPSPGVQLLPAALHLSAGRKWRMAWPLKRPVMTELVREHTHPGGCVVALRRGWAGQGTCSSCSSDSSKALDPSVGHDAVCLSGFLPCPREGQPGSLEPLEGGTIARLGRS